MHNMPYIASGAMVVFGLYVVLFQRNLIKIAIGLSLLELGVNLFLVSLGYREGGIAPIYTMAPTTGEMVLPIPQALTLTAIVIGFATTALLLAIIVGIHRHYGTLDIAEVRRLRG
jgi:multisubunit Na+/H+ antiporter MnhC subunit